MVSHLGLHRAHPYSEPSADQHPPNRLRKQACLACRRRKKRCDGNRPACSTCSAWDFECVYASASQASLDYGFPTPNSTLGSNATAQNLPVTLFGLPPELFPLPSETENPINHGVPAYGGPSLDSDSPTYPSNQLPSTEQIVQLTEEFFVRLHPQFPCIHKETFLDRLRGSPGPAPSTPLEWAVIATAARAHRDTTVSSRADMLLQTAVNSLAQSPLLRENVLLDLQAAVWCVFSLYYSGEITRAVVLLAQAYSLACLNGLHQLDDPNPNVPGTMQFTPLEGEECRATLWALFVLDRHINYLMGRHFVIDDMHWCVNYPLDDRSLQHGPRPEPEPYDRHLAALASDKPNIPIGVSLRRLVCKASVIMGRIVTYKSINPIPTDADGTQRRLADFHELQSALACFWVSLPACVHNVAEVPPENVDQSVWLLITLHSCSTLLFYITDVERRSPGAPGGASLPTARENFLCSYKSVDKVVAALRQLSGLAIDAVLNPMLAPSYFMCCRFILARCRRESQPQSYRLDLNLVLKLLERMAERQAQLPRIYKEIIDLELERDVQGGVDGGRLLLRTDYCFLI
ncbi:hypothetical protein BJX61DRAFT_494969 [Aspergillus egyptiacus]|nr:hypothetical protein BJX61DRAFT_494969 [Aspergillus egyptiacus]